MDPARNHRGLIAVPIPTPIHVSVHFVPDLHPQCETRTIFDQEIECLNLGQTRLDRPFPNPFDEVLVQLDKRLNAYVEGDGSFVFTGRIDDDTAWRVNGTIYEADDRIQNVEMWIDNARVEALETALSVLGIEPQQCVYQLLTAGVFVSHHAFCKAAGLS